MAGRYVKVYTDFADAMLPLQDAEVGRLFRAMLIYAESGEVPDLRGNERFVWAVAKSNIDQCNKAYEKMCSRNKNNATSRYQSQPVATSGNQSQPVVANKDIYKHMPSKDMIKSDMFDNFWSAYPKKAGKKDAMKVWSKINPSQQIAEKILVGLEKCKSSQQWRDGFIPNASTFLNGERWNDELPTVRRKASAAIAYQQHDYTDAELDSLLVDLDSEVT